jgi:hypothetical protein
MGKSLDEKTTGSSSRGHGLSIAAIVLALLSLDACGWQANSDDLLIPFPKHGFVSRLPASRWEESMITGNGTTGALVLGDPLDERIILSHERLSMPEYPPAKAPALHKHIEQIRKLTLSGRGTDSLEDRGAGV